MSTRGTLHFTLHCACLLACVQLHLQLQSVLQWQGNLRTAVYMLLTLPLTYGDKRACCLLDDLLSWLLSLLDFITR
jgi:uncharacterized protein involved in tolerance to divalent cations